MGEGLSRSEFLRGRFFKRPDNSGSIAAGRSPIRPPIRPPNAIPEPQFFTRCDGCKKCVSSCPQAIISIDHNQKAQLNFGPGAVSAEAGCIFCGACTDVCPTSALDAKYARPWRITAKLDTKSCLSLAGIVCRTCGDVCEAEAISFQLMTMGRARPGIDTDACTGCGTCVALCPGKAMALGEMPAPDRLSPDSKEPRQSPQQTDTGVSS